LREFDPSLKQPRRSPKRSKVELYATVLEVIKVHPEGARITKMSYGVGVPIDRLKPILKDLASFGLLQTQISEDQDEGGTFYVLTPRAFEFLETYWKMKSFLEVFGSSVQRDFLV
jgi:predicted transcriptional regulator